MRDYYADPPFLVELRQPLNASPVSSLKRANLAPRDSAWQLLDSARERVEPPLIFQTRSLTAESLPDLMEGGHARIVSDAFRRCVEPYLKDAEFIETGVELGVSTEENAAVGGGDLVKGYHWLNCWRRLDIVDWEQSEFAGKINYSEGMIETPRRVGGIRKLKLRGGFPRDEHLFVLKHVSGDQYFISPELHEATLQANLRVTFIATVIDGSYAVPLRTLRENLAQKSIMEIVNV